MGTGALGPYHLRGMPPAVPAGRDSAFPADTPSYASRARRATARPPSPPGALWPNRATGAVFRPFPHQNRMEPPVKYFMSPGREQRYLEDKYFLISPIFFSIPSSSSTIARMSR